MPLSQDDLKALHNLSRYPEAYALRKLITDHIEATLSVEGLDVSYSAEILAGQVAGKQQTAKFLQELLDQLSPAETRKPHINTHE